MKPDKISMETLEAIFEKAKELSKNNVKDPYKFQTELGETAKEVAKAETSGGRRRLGYYKPGANVIGNLICTWEDSFFSLCTIPPRPAGMEYDENDPVDTMLLQMQKERKNIRFLMSEFIEHIYQSSISNSAKGIEKVSEMVKDIQYPSQLPAKEFPTPTALSSKD